MPGITLHLWTSKKILDKLSVPYDCKLKFFAGSVLPDVFNDKNQTHHWVTTQNPFFMNPNISAVQDDICGEWSWLTLGILSHLMLDEVYNTNYLMEQFSWNISKGTDGKYRAKITTNNLIEYTDEQFFSAESGIYKDYTVSNPTVIDKYLSEYIDNIPEVIPSTGISVYDENRRAKTWKQELNEYLQCKEKEHYSLIKLEDLDSFFEEFAIEFIYLMSSIIFKLGGNVK